MAGEMVICTINAPIGFPQQRVRLDGQGCGLIVDSGEALKRGWRDKKFEMVACVFC